MKTLLATLRKIIPEGMDQLVRRYAILDVIACMQPIGRRSLAVELGLSERVIRSEIEILKKQGLLEVSSVGMKITTEGQATTGNLFAMMQELQGLSRLEQKLAEMFEARGVIVVNGDVDKDENIKRELGRVGAMLVKQLLAPDSVVALTGGTTIAYMVQAIRNVEEAYEDVLILPARGSVGRNVELQANTLAAKMAKQLHAAYRLLNIPDNLSKKALDSVRKEPQIQCTLQKVAQADLLIFGIGNAIKMAARRGVSAPVIDFLDRKKAVAEAFGYYFGPDGDIVYVSRTIGIDLTVAQKAKTRIAIAGGVSKASAIVATKELLKDGYLVIDEGAARKILSL